MTLTVLLEVEYEADTEDEARQLAHRDAVTLFRQNDVLAVSADLKRPKDALPITEAYLKDVVEKTPGGPQEANGELLGGSGGVVERVGEYVPHQMDVDECIAEALRGE